VTDRDGDGKADIVVVSYVQDSNDTVVHVQTLYSNGDGTFTNNGFISQYTIPGYNVIIPNGGAQFVTMGGTKYLTMECEAYDESYFSVGTSVLFFQDLGGGRSLQPVSVPAAQEVDFPSQSLFALSWVNGLSMADVNGDGIPDITLSFGDDYLYGALGNSSGGFGPQQIIESGTYPFAPSGWALVDVNGDGIPDMIDMEAFDSEIWLGNGDGTFADPQVSYPNNANNSVYPGSYPGNNLVAADLARNGRIDYIVTDSSSAVFYNRASVYMGRGDGTFTAAPAMAPTNANPPAGALGRLYPVDLNGDGIADWVAVNEMNRALVAASNDGKGNFTYNANAIPFGQNGFYLLNVAGAGDFNGDGRQDLVLVGFQPGNVYTYQGNPYNVYSIAVAMSNGDGTFAAPTVIASSTQFLYYPSDVLVGSINEDGKQDIVIPYGGDRAGFGFPPPPQHNQPGIWVAMGNGDGTFQSTTYTNMVQTGSGGFLDDLNGSGYLSLILYGSKKKESSLFMIPGSATGFQPQNETTLVDLSDWWATDFHGADVNNDGLMDLLVSTSGMKTDTNGQNAGINVYLNDGKGGFTLASTAGLGLPYPGIFSVADFNGDGCPDMISELAVADEETTTTYGAHVLLGNCDGTFQAPQAEISVPAYPVFYPARLTWDGATSVLVSSGNSAHYALYNQGGNSVSLSADSTSIVQGATVSFTAGIESTWPSRPVPTGTVSFYDNGTLLTTEAVSGGSASYSTSGLAAGSHAISVSYSGDENYNPHSSAAQVSVTVATPVSTQPEVSISAPPQTLSLARGESKTVTLSVVGSANYNGSVKFSVAGETGGLNVTVNPASVSLSNGKPEQVAITVSTLPNKSTAMVRPGYGLPGMPIGATALGMCLLGMRRMRRRSLWICMLIVTSALGLCAMSTGCGSSHYAKAGVSKIVVTATPSVAGASVQTSTFMVVVE